MAHTPGPWTGQDENGKFNSNHDWSLDHETASSSESAPIWANGKVIAFVVHSSESFSLRSHPSVTANARLIAAAPDLVFQLLAAANYIDALGGDSKTYRAAIAKATGGQ